MPESLHPVWPLERTVFFIKTIIYVNKFAVSNSSFFYPWFACLIAVGITKALGLPKQSLFSNYKIT